MQLEINFLIECIHAVYLTVAQKLLAGFIEIITQVTNFNSIKLKMEKKRNTFKIVASNYRRLESSELLPKILLKLH